jgi:tetratricopeptide (TPR) repeat protein
MKRAIRIRIVSSVVIALALMAGGVQAQEPGAESCASADALRKAELYDEARDEYLDLLKANPALECALEGLQLMVRALYVEALGIDPTFDEAWNALKRLGLPQAQDQEPPAEYERDDLALARAEAADGSYEEAIEHLRTTISQEAPEFVVPSDLAYLLELDKARGLAEQGFDEKAREALQSAIEKNPALKVPDDLA